MGTIPRTATQVNKTPSPGDEARSSDTEQARASTSAHNPQPAGLPSIVLRDVQVERGRDSVLDVESLDINAGYTALVGPNGSGKSTMLHLIAGLLRPATGTIDVRSSSPGPTRVAYVLQSQHTSEHLLVTAREVVQLARRSGPLGRANRADRQVVSDVMERLSITDLANRHLADMSGGQRQRVFIAQGLAQDSDILLLDEPVAGLDLASEQTIRQAINDERASGRAVVVATHDLDEAGRADRVIMLNGTVVAAGTPLEVLQPENLRKAYRGHVLELGDGAIAVDDAHHH